MTLSAEQGFAPWIAISTVLQGWALAEKGMREAGQAQIRQGLAAYQATGSEVSRPYFLALLADVCGKAGQIEEGLTLLDEALAVVYKTGNRFYETELLRVKGELLLHQAVPDVPRAEACFQQALTVARSQRRYDNDP